MLRAISKNNANQLVEVYWYQGKPSPFAGATYYAVYQVGEIYADGDELDWIRITFPTLPVPIGKTARFFGDFAKLIAGNLP